MLARTRPARISATLIGMALVAGACSATPSVDEAKGTPADADSAPGIIQPMPPETLETPVDTAPADSIPPTTVPTPGPTSTSPASPVEVNLRAGSTVGVAFSGTGIGITHTQHSADSWGAPDAVARARSLIPSVASTQNQHIYGWGTLNPNPAPGQFDWRSLDSRVEMMRQTRGTPVITLCCAPDWMKGGAPGSTNWGRLEVAPNRQHFDDFAALARTVALRYPDVRHFQVWNEMKGFWNPSLNRWDHEAYTDLYNLVYRELKAVNPAIQVGGPYVVVGSWANPAAASHPSTLRGPWGTADRRDLDVVEYWLENAVGADFIAIDAWTGTRDRGMQSDVFAATTKFRDVGRWVRQRTDVPIWWSEWYVTPDYPQATGGEWTSERISALIARALIELSMGDSDIALHWAPQPEATACGACLWTDTRLTGGGRVTSTGEAVRLLRQHVEGRELRLLDHDAPGLTAVASVESVVIINELGRQRQISIDGTPLTVAAHGVVAHPR